MFLVTGGAGFVGSHIIEYLLSKGEKVASIDSYRHKGCPLRHINGCEYLSSDLSHPITPRLLKKIKELNVKYIINAASLSHVDTSITDPVWFVKNNIDLVLNMLELARDISPEIFFQVSTDEVYGAAPNGYNHKEYDVILPSNPYAASKASQEAIAISYWRTYSTPIVITNTMNMIGERQDQEKYLPMIFSKIKKGETIKVHGTPGSIGSRYYLYAKDFADALYFIKDLPLSMYKDGDHVRPSRYNVVGTEEINNLELVQKVESVLNLKANYEFEDFHKTRAGHDRRYALDGSYLASLGWTPKTAIIDAISKINVFNDQYPEWLS